MYGFYLPFMHVAFKEVFLKLTCLFWHLFNFRLTFLFSQRKTVFRVWFNLLFLVYSKKSLYSKNFLDTYRKFLDGCVLLTVYHISISASHGKIKVIYTKYSKHWPYTVTHTIDWVCSKILNHGLNRSFTFQAYTLPHILNCIFVSQSKFQIWILKLF